MTQPSGQTNTTGEESRQAVSSRQSFRTGLVPFLLVFSFWLLFSESCITFDREDNVTATGPLLVEAARQVCSGIFPSHTYSVGGGGGTPLISIMQPGVLNPLKLLPAILLGQDPETMMNVIVSLHLAFFALGGWFLAWVMRAQTWAGLVAAFSLGFSGSYAVGAGNWEGIVLPFTFLPWIFGGILSIAEATSTGQLLGAHLVTGWASLSILFSGAPVAGFYGLMAVFWLVLWVVWGDLERLKMLLVRLIPQALLLCLLAGPLMWEAWRVYEYYGRENPLITFHQLSVPPPAYLGLLLPRTESLWFHVGAESVFTNFVMFCGGVAPWFVVVLLAMRPALLFERRTAVLLLGILLFVPVLSPAAFGLSSFFARTPVLDLFRWPFRGIPAFHVLLVFLFLTMTMSVQAPLSRLVQAGLVVVCFAVGVYAVGYEFQLARPGLATDCWFTTDRYYDDPETWSPSSLARLERGGYLLSIARLDISSAWFEKPRLFFIGNLGAQFRVHTVHRYILAAQSPAYKQVGMYYDGLVYKWEAARRFIESSLPQPGAENVVWENGIGPRDIGELANKTYVAAVVVETVMENPMNYFAQSDEWELLEKRRTAALFVRKRE